LPTTKLLLEAIANTRCVTAVYNRSTIRLAPHILYTRHGEIFVDGVTTERDGKPPREFKISAFKLTGLQSIELANRSFTPADFFNAGDQKYQGVTLFAVC
jgi:hypothetical protein